MDELANFTIPKQHQDGLVRLLRLSEEEARKLRDVIKEMPASIKTSSIKSRVRSEFDALSPEQADSIANALVSLYSLRNYLDLPIPDFTDQLVEAMNQSGNEALTVPKDKTEQFEMQMASLLDSDPLTVTAKAPDVWFEHKHAFCSARILTDIRPIFGADVEELPLAAGIVHNLKITYHIENRTEDFYVALDSGDVLTLREVLDRADAKFETLKSILDAAKVSFLDSE